MCNLIKICWIFVIVSYLCYLLMFLTAFDIIRCITKKTKNPFSEKTEKGRKKSALPPKFCNKITALNVLSYAFLLTEDSGETYWLKIQVMFSLHLREDICHWKCTCSHQTQALWNTLFKNSIVLFNEFRWSLCVWWTSL